MFKTILKWLGLTSDEIQVEPFAKNLFSCDNLEIAQFDAIIEARQLMAGKPLC